MSRATTRKVAILEPVTIFFLIMAYIWDLRVTHHDAWAGILALMIVSHILHRENVVGLGFELSSLPACLGEFAPALAFLVLTFLAGGILCQTIRPVGLNGALLAWAAYLPWAIFQQYVMNGYFLNRLDKVFPRRTAPVVAALMFSGAHLPNWFLMGVGLLAGYCCAVVYRKYKNLYFLGIAHATIGVLLLMVLPDSVTHHLIVGPACFRN